MIPDKNLYPKTAADCMYEIAEFLDLADRAFARLAELQNLTLAPGDEVQKSLRRLGDYLIFNPEMDNILYRILVPDKQEDSNGTPPPN